MSYWLNAEATWNGAALLARWFRFQPSEIDALSVADFQEWIHHAHAQITRERGG